MNIKTKRISNYKVYYLPIIIIIGGLFIFMFFYNNKYTNLVKYFEDLLNVRIDKFVDEVEGEVLHNWKEEYMSIKIKVMDEYKNEILKVLEDRFVKREISEFEKAGYDNSSFAIEMRQNIIDSLFVYYDFGKTSKTRSIHIYVTYDKDNNMYIYAFG